VKAGMQEVVNLFSEDGHNIIAHTKGMLFPIFNYHHKDSGIIFPDRELAMKTIFEPK
jgi:hypothetical protein